MLERDRIISPKTARNSPARSPIRDGIRQMLYDITSIQRVGIFGVDRTKSSTASRAAIHTGRKWLAAHLSDTCLTNVECRPLKASFTLSVEIASQLATFTLLRNFAVFPGIK